MLVFSIWAGKKGEKKKNMKKIIKLCDENNTEMLQYIH